MELKGERHYRFESVVASRESMRTCLKTPKITAWLKNFPGNQKGLFTKREKGTGNITLGKAPSRKASRCTLGGDVSGKKMSVGYSLGKGARKVREFDVLLGGEPHKKESSETPPKRNNVKEIADVRMSQKRPSIPDEHIFTVLH